MSETDIFCYESIWEDKRTGDEKDDGRFEVMFELCRQGVSDYNTYLSSTHCQAYIAYAKEYGSWD